MTSYTLPWTYRNRENHFNIAGIGNDSVPVNIFNTITHQMLLCGINYINL